MTDFYDLNTRNKEDRMETFWICYVLGTDGGEHYRHQSLEKALLEAERLARLPNVKGKAVFLLECIGKCQVDNLPIRWEVAE